MWFKETKDEQTGAKIYQIKTENGYWKRRERGKWQDVPDLF